MIQAQELFQHLIEIYDHQGWWPIPSRAETRGYNGGGYHPGCFPDYSPADRFEIAAGAVLTQNTTWKNARRALHNLAEAGISGAEELLSLPEASLAECIRPSGYFNQKAKKLRLCIGFLLKDTFLQTGSPPDRSDLLKLWGIGPETADSILLYAFYVPVFVIDTYTRRFFSRLDPSFADYDYPRLQAFFHESLPRDVELYQEYHALIVRHSKEYCTKRPQCRDCPLKHHCVHAELNEAERSVFPRNC